MSPEKTPKPAPKKHGGHRPGAGRPIGGKKTGAKSRNETISIRLPASAIALLAEIAARRKLSRSMVVVGALMRYDLEV